MRYLLDTNVWITYFMITAIALAHDLTVVTHNSGEFTRVPGLRVEDWSV